MNKAKILVVDDDPKLCALVSFMLKRFGGYEVREETRSFAAVATAQEFGPDLVVLDVEMPGRDGGEVATALRVLPQFRQTPIIFLSGLVAASECGMKRDGLFLSKPVDASLLLASVSRLLTGAVADPVFGKPAATPPSVLNRRPENPVPPPQLLHENLR